LKLLQKCSNNFILQNSGRIGTRFGFDLWKYSTFTKEASGRRY